MRILRSILILVAVVSAQVMPVWADTHSFIITADVPETVGGNAIVEEGIVGQSGTRDATEVWDFGQLQYDSQYGIWVSDTVWYLTLNGRVTFSYTDTSNPNLSPGYSGHGLGYKASIAFNEVVNANTEIPVAGWEGLHPIRSMDGDVFTPAMVHNHYLKIYVGIYRGNPPVDGLEPFTNADHGGTYQGTLTITVVAS